MSGTKASEDELKKIIERFIDRTAVLAKQDGTSFNNKHLLKLDMGTAIEALIRTEKLKLLNELDKSMPIAEQLTTKYGYHMPERMYGYKLALHDIREVIAKLEAEL